MRTAVVMAHILQEGAEPITLAYAPVKFEDDVDYDSKELRSKRIILFVSFVSIIGLFGGLTYCMLRWTKSSIQKEYTLRYDPRGHEHQMHEIPSSLATSTEES